MTEPEIVNKVDRSGVVQLDLESLWPAGERRVFDLKDYLVDGLVLREKDFRQALKEHDWEAYRDCFVALTCTADAIVPTWAFMLAAVYLDGVARRTVFGDAQRLEEMLFEEALAGLDPSAYRDRSVIVKGCSDKVPLSAYAALVRVLKPVVKSLQFGEPCSTVPLFKTRS